MKLSILSILFLINSAVFAQQNSEEEALKKTVEIFFEGFHEQDSVKIKSVMADLVILQSIGSNKSGEVVIINEEFGNFLNSIVSIPSEISFREILHSYEIKVDGKMANVWTTYSFYSNGKFSHCGVNNFQLVKMEGEWRIFYLVDTRRKDGCGQSADKWEETIKKFETTDKSDMPAKGVILFTGSSSIAMWKDIKEAFPRHKVLNRGFGGSEFSDLLYYADRIIYPHQPSKIFIYEGDNDLAAGESIESILMEAKRIREEIKERLPVAPVIFISPKPSLSRWDLKEKYEELNQALEEYAEETKLTEFADIWSPMLGPDGKVREDLFLEDDLHMNEKGYEIWKKVLLPFLEGMSENLKNKN